MKHRFSRLASWCADAVGSPWAFLGACVCVLVWLGSGPLFGWSDTWQLIINTATTISTGLMVFLIQHAQNRDTAALMLKVNEVIAALPAARNTVIDAENLSDEQLQAMIAELQRRARGPSE